MPISTTRMLAAGVALATLKLIDTIFELRVEHRAISDA